MLFTCFLTIFTFFASVSIAQVHTGLDNLIAGKYSQLQGKKVGLICNRTSVTSKGEFSAKLFAKQRSFKLAALFSPEHGLFGQRKAGVKSDSTEFYEGIPVYSLYGSNRKPSKKMIDGIDVIVYDIQDIGVRPYTYLSTMIYAMEMAAENGIEFIVLDRPNPLSGKRIEGNILDSTLASFVGIIPIPYLHGMTLGELALMAKGKKWFHEAEKLKLSVIKLTGWQREMYWDQTGLKWVSPSPNIPTFESAIGCAMFGAIGELGILSVGIGSDKPFLRLGSKLVKPEILEQAVTSSLPKEIILTREDYTVPFEDSSKTFLGMRIGMPKNIPNEIYGPQFIIIEKLLADSVFAKSFRGLPAATRIMFNKVTGSKKLMNAFEKNVGVASLIENWKKDVQLFKSRRKPYLLYE
jgi:uncharacterized protein YbbC (DUF1343 family)